MAKYIEKKALEVALNHRLNFLIAENGEYDHYTSGFDEAVTRVENFPAADVAPVRHGRWNADETCSCCGEKSTEGLDAEKWNYWFPDFCPNCGATMDLED